MSLQEFSDMVRKDPKFLFSCPEDMVASFTQVTDQVIPPKLPDLFMTLPQEDLR